MKGKHRIIVQDKFLKYDFTINRNITLLRGNSATGKTTLVEMILDNNNDGLVEVVCDVPCIAIPNSKHWDILISQYNNSILFFDEDCDFVKTKQFASIVKNSSNYYVIINRNNLSTLPYSINEIYEIRESKHYGNLKQIQNEFVRI